MVQAAAGAEDHEDVNMDNALGGKSSGFDRNSSPQIAGNLAPPSESKGANGETSTVRLLCISASLLFPLQECTVSHEYSIVLLPNCMLFLHLLLLYYPLHSAYLSQESSGCCVFFCCQTGSDYSVFLC